MKTHFRKSTLVLAALTALTLSAGGGLASAGSAGNAKAGYESCDKMDAGHFHGKADKEWRKTLTTEQKAQMKELHASLEKELAPLRAKIGDKRAELKSVAATDNPDMGSLRRLVDEISALEKEATLSRYANMIKVRSLLTPEQKAAFDKAIMKHGDHGKGRGK